MVRARRRRIYWDSCVWLRYINESPEDKRVLDWLLEQSSYRMGDIEIITSAISLAEVAFAIVEQTKQALDEDVERQIDYLWADHSAITIVEFYPQIAIEARSLIRMGIPRGWSLTPLDAVHLATARRLQATEFHTYDTRLFRYSDDVGFPVKEPYVPGGLPPEQTSFLTPDDGGAK